MKYITTCLLFTCLFTNLYAGNIQGKITDANGKALPYASITVKGTTKGTTANSEGQYSLSLAEGKYIIVAQYVGYTRTEKEISVKQATLQLDFVLEQQPLTLAEVVVKRGEDPAYEIIREAIRKREYYNKQVDSLSVTVYIKGILRSGGMPARIFGKKIERSAENGLDSAGKGILFLSESITQVDMAPPENIKYRVISSRESGGGYGLSFPFFINFYQNNVSIFDNNLNPRGFVSPIADGALHYYRYKYEGSYVEDGKMINSIKVTPRRKNEPLFSGTIHIVEDDWRIHSLDLSTNKNQQLELLDTLRIKQIHAKVENDIWKTQNQVLDIDMKQFGFKINGSFINVYSDYDINPGFEKKHFGRTVMKYDTSFNKKDSVYWSTIRPIALEPEEKRDFIFKDSVQQVRRDSMRSKTYIDSLRANRKAISLSQVFWSGVNRPFYGKNGTVQWNVKPLLPQLEYNTVEGVSVNLEQSFRISRRNSKYNYLINLNSRYGFANTHFNTWGNLHISPKENSYRQRFFDISGGKRVSQFNKDNPINPITNAAYTLLGRRNYMKLYENWFGRVEYQNKLENGMKLNVHALWEDRIPLWNRSDFSISSSKRDFLPNHPIELSDIDFKAHQAFIVGASFSWQPGQRYIEFPTHKMAIGSSAPVFDLSYQKGINKVLGSDIRFDKWRFSMSDNMNFKLGGEFKYRVGVGGFLNNDSVGIPDLQHFNGNQTFYNINYLNSFQLAPYYRYSNAESFFAFGHAEHHFNGLLTNKIPLFNKLKWHLVAGANTFYVNRNNYYLELFGGLENIFKLFRVDLVTAIQPGAGNTWGVRIGLGGLLGGKAVFQ